MAKDDIERYIRTRKSRTLSVDEQIEISHRKWDRTIGPSHEGIKRMEVEEELGLDLDYEPGTSLSHLVEIDLVDEFLRPGPDTLVIASWLEDGVINGEVEETADEAVEALIAHMQDDDPADDGRSPVVADGAGTTVRREVADRFDLVPEGVEDHLRTGDPVEKLNDAVDAIEDEDNELETRDDYGEILFINPAYRYRLTPTAVELYQQEGE